MDSPSQPEEHKIRRTLNSVPSSELPTSDSPVLAARPLVANRYAIVSRIGKGGMGEVWHAYDQKLRVDVALKSFRLDLRRADDPIEALRREVRTAREVISPNVCRIFDLVVEEDQELISMEYVDGITLTALLVQRGPLDLKQARDIAAQFLSGLEAIHKAGLVHRDFKPENIMITRAGRVVVMDFGIAKQISEIGGSISGTLPYMSPEQLAAEPVDGRSDVFSAGVVLAEMIHPKRILSVETREQIWNMAHENPLGLPDGPWKAVILRALAVSPDDRYVSAASLSRALEEATQRIDTVEEQNPYPGLSSFTTENAENFFGRELEVENVIKRLQQSHLMGLIGSSGAGKTSFLRAGLIPALPSDWAHIFCVPGDSPTFNLAQSLATPFSGDTEAVQRLLRFEDLKNTFWLLSRWRQKHSEAILIIDRFEELFTLNSPEVQASFAQLISGAALESDIRVLISMRDDFLIRCQDFADLTPLFSELTPLGPLTGSALRRALVQPALKAGYRFEDELFIDEILSDIEKERGALPLMAFAASRLWERRKRESGLLTRKAYQQIGGVAGALAQHAEATMERIGSERQAFVREIFRNMMTSQNTRAARDTEELLSVFQERKIAEEVLRILIDARLLTSFEAPSADGEKPRRRVEIIHESLLTAWPRLVRWQNQDADSALLRDQLRQAAQLWEQRNRSKDLLWTGTAFLEFQAWRQRYPGNLSSTEEEFAQAMILKANRRRRQRRLVISTTFVVLIVIMGIITLFWHEASISRDKAVVETKSAQASKMLALGRAIPNADPSTKLAYALASLEFRDTAEGRRFALQALSEGPPAQVLPISFPHLMDAELSPDGQWLSVTAGGGIQLFSRDGKGPLIANERLFENMFIQWKSQFFPDGKFLMWTNRKDPGLIKVWSLLERKVVRTFHFEGPTVEFIRNDTAIFVTNKSGDENHIWWWGECVIRQWKLGAEKLETIGNLNLDKKKNHYGHLDVDSSGRFFAYLHGNDVCLRELDPAHFNNEIVVGSHLGKVDCIRFRPNALQLVSDSEGEIHLWSLLPNQKNPLRVIKGTDNTRFLWFDPKGNYLFAAGNDELLRWDLRNSYAEPVRLRNVDGIQSITFDRNENWMAVSGDKTVAFYPQTHTPPFEFRPTTRTQHLSNVRFTPDGKYFLTCFSEDGLLITSTPAESEQTREMLWSSPLTTMMVIDVDSSGKFVLGALESQIHLVPIADHKDIRLKAKAPDEAYLAVAFSPDGKSAAATGGRDSFEIWNLQSGNSIVLEKSKGIFFDVINYGPDGSLFAGDDKGKLYQWNLKNQSYKILHESKGETWALAISKDGRYVATSTRTQTSELRIYDLKTNKSLLISSHGNQVRSLTFDPSGKKIITGDADGVIRVGPITGELPYLLLSNDGVIKSVDVDPSAKWIASGGTNGSPVRLWRMPETISLETLPYENLLNRLRELTNVRAIADSNSPTGYRTDFASFRGWEKTAEW